MPGLRPTGPEPRDRPILPLHERPDHQLTNVTAGLAHFHAIRHRSWPVQPLLAQCASEAESSGLFLVVQSDSRPTCAVLLLLPLCGSDVLQLAAIGSSRTADVVPMQRTQTGPARWRFSSSSIAHQISRPAGFRAPSASRPG
jgi:hypothetical protein